MASVLGRCTNLYCLIFMKNIKNTTQYTNLIKIILIMVIFSVSIPLITFAQSDSGSTGEISGSGSTGTIIGSGSTGTIIGSGSTGTIIGSGSTGTIIGSGSTGTIIGSGYGQQSFTVSSANFSDGNSTYVPLTYGSYPQSYTVGSASFSGGNSSYTGPENYFYPQSYTVSSASFSDGSVNYPYQYSQPTFTQNQVLAYTDTNPSLSSVYLSDVPYTGLADSLPMVIFIFSLTLWSGILAYAFLKRKIKSYEPVAVISTSETNKNHSMTSSFMNQIFADSSDVNEVEKYARMNKILLSSDASAKIVKLSRLGKINASEYIRSIATGEWKAIGEGDIR